MKELHKSSYNDVTPFENNEGQRGLLCSNKTSLRCPSLSSSPKFSKDTREALEELGNVLKSIRRRMYAEGFEIVNGVVVKRANVNVYE